MSVARWSAVVCLLSACGARVGDAYVELGTGLDAFEPLSEGGPIYIVQGPQGGFHFFGSLRAGGVDPGDYNRLDAPNNPTTEFRVFHGADRVDLMAATYVQGLAPVGSGTYEMIGRLVLLNILSDAELDGVEVRFEVHVTDVHGAWASDARTLTAMPHPNNL